MFLTIIALICAYTFTFINASGMVPGGVPPAFGGVPLPPPILQTTTFRKKDKAQIRPYSKPEIEGLLPAEMGKKSTEKGNKSSTSTPQKSEKSSISISKKYEDKDKGRGKKNRSAGPSEELSTQGNFKAKEFSSSKLTSHAVTSDKVKIHDHSRSGKLATEPTKGRKTLDQSMDAYPPIGAGKPLPPLLPLTPPPAQQPVASTLPPPVVLTPPATSGAPSPLPPFTGITPPPEPSTGITPPSIIATPPAPLGEAPPPQLPLIGAQPPPSIIGGPPVVPIGQAPPPLLPLIGAQPPPSIIGGPPVVPIGEAPPAPILGLTPPPPCEETPPTFEIPPPPLETQYTPSNVPPNFNLGGSAPMVLKNAVLYSVLATSAIIFVAHALV